ncbi:ion channel [soil metagenome]
MMSRKPDSKISTSINTGFGTNASFYGGRFVNKKGNPNIEKRGVGILDRISWYHSLLALSRLQFFSMILIFFILINIFFAAIYYLIGIENLGGVSNSSPLVNFAEAFFFSCQTFTTVGYGHISPVGLLTSFIAALEALLGLLSFALATGLLFGRFARPKAYIKFSHNAIIAPYKNITALMIRLAPFKNTTLIDAESKITLGLGIEENGVFKNNFYQLQLEFPAVNTLTLSWTIVHPITEDSPLYNFTAEDYKNMKGEVLVFVKAFDDMFANTVVARTSYTFHEIVYGAKFVPMYHRSSQNDKTVIYLDKLNSFTREDLVQKIIL